jgi:hypothetical protein
MQKDELWKLKYSTMQKYSLIFILKNPIKETKKNPSRYYKFITNLKFQHKPKDHVSKVLELKKYTYYYYYY